MGDKDMEQNVLERILDGSIKPRDLPFTLLAEITDNFSDERKIGKGGFSQVYKGVLQNAEVAVKKIRSHMTISEKSFHREIDSLVNSKHQNVVRFLGFCSNTEHKLIQEERPRNNIYAEKRERLLCFEYIPNGSLDKYIADELRGLEWDTRYKIIKGICEGVQYLHQDMHIIHMDMKPHNILINDQMVPKITDFGLSRPDEISLTMTEHRAFTRIYCAPEYEYGGKMSTKSDIYSLGVIIIELVTGRRGIPDNMGQVLRRWRHRWNKSTKYAVQLQYQQVTKCLELAIMCMYKNPNSRPSILDIIRVLSEIGSTNVYISNAGESADSQIEDDMLGIEPLKVCFPFELNKEVSCSLELSNDTDACIAFNIKATNSLKYYTLPNKGIVRPGSKCMVKITPQSQHNTQQGTDEFIVQSTKVNEGLTADDITDAMFTKTSEEVDEVNLPVVFDTPTSAPCLFENPKHNSSPTPLAALGFKLQRITASDETEQTSTKAVAEPSHSQAGRLFGIAGLIASARQVRSGPSETELLDIQPHELHFSFEPNKQASCELCIINKSDRYVVFLPREDQSTYMYFGTGYFITVVEPRSTVVKTVYMRPEHNRPPLDACKFEIRMITMESESGLDHLLLRLGYNRDIADNDVFKWVDGLGGKVYRATLRTVICEPATASETVITKMELGTEELGSVKSMDVHPTEPWMFIGYSNGYVSIWNYQTQEKVNSLRITDEPSRSNCPELTIRYYSIDSAKFIVQRQWVVFGTGDGYIHVYTCPTLKEVTKFKACSGSVYSLAVHPTHPLLLSSGSDNTSFKDSDMRFSSSDDLTKLWNWESGWICTRTFEKHQGNDREVRFNPNDPDTFATVDLLGKITVWSIYSSTAITTLDESALAITTLHGLQINSDRRYMITESPYAHAKIWDLLAETCAHSFISGIRYVPLTDKQRPYGWTNVAWHPTLPIIFTCSYDGIYIWNSSTYRLEKKVHCSSYRHAIYFGFIYPKRLVMGFSGRVEIMEIDPET